MHAFFDLLTSIILAAGVALTLGSIQSTGKEAAVETSGYRTGRAEAQSFVRLLAQDLRNMGAGGIASPILDSDDSTFVFVGPSAPGGSPDTIAYRSRRAGSGPSGERLYRVARRVNGRTGSVLRRVERWEVDCLSPLGDTLYFSNPAYRTDTWGIRVAMRMRPRYTDRETDERSDWLLRWRSTFWPLALRSP